MTNAERALELHKEWRGKLEVVSRASVSTPEELALAYTPGVAEPCKVIAKDTDAVYEYTRKWNMVAVVTDGTAVLGLGDIGPEAGLPVMEGKAVLFKTFGGVDAIPILIGSKDVEDIVRTVKLISSGLGGINLEDISAPRCFEVEKRLKAELNIPVFHDDQHGTAIVVAAGLINALKLTGKKMSEIRVVINGVGAAGNSCARLMLSMGVRDIVLCGRDGVLDPATQKLDAAKLEIEKLTNPGKVRGSLADALRGADVFIGVSVAGAVTSEMVAGMKEDAILFAMANPVPEIYPDQAKAGGALVVGTGRSDFPNQINNVLAFPGIFRGALDVRASDINEEMKLAAAYAIAGLVGDDLAPDYVIPKAFDPRVGAAVGAAVAEAARKSGVARI